MIIALERWTFYIWKKANNEWKQTRLVSIWCCQTSTQHVDDTKSLTSGSTVLAQFVIISELQFCVCATPTSGKILEKCYRLVPISSSVLKVVRQNKSGWGRKCFFWNQTKLQQAGLVWLLQWGSHGSRKQKSVWLIDFDWGHLAPS